MSINDLLSQDEIDALLHGVDSGAVSTEPEPVDPGTARTYDFASQDRIIRGRMPTLEMVNERFVRLWRIGLFSLIRRSADLSVRGIDLVKFGDYMHSLYVPTNLNLIRFKPLRGMGLIVFEPKLVFTVVDNFFGGDGRYPTRIEGREFTPTEMRVLQLLLKQTFTDLVEAWAPVMDVESSTSIPRSTRTLPTSSPRASTWWSAASTSNWRAAAARSTSPCPTRCSSRSANCSTPASRATASTATRAGTAPCASS